MKVFVGSSSESESVALDVKQVLRALGHEPVGWKDRGVFVASSTIIETIERVGRECQAAVLIAAEDDQTTHRGKADWTPRDNVVYEAGYFTGRFGRERCALVRVGNPKLPSDLDGVLDIRLPAKKDYDVNSARDTLHDHLRDWLDQMSSAAPKGAELPRIARVIADVVARLRGHEKIPHFDLMAADLLESLAESLRTDKGITSELIQIIAEDALPTAKGIYAIDVLGPSGWLNPTAFRYLAVQIRQYIRCNVSGDGWHLKVSDRLCEAIRAGTTYMNGSSATLFDNKEQLDWKPGEPALEFCRVLLWSEEELLSPIAESVIEIHEAFNVPLFFIPRPIDHVDRAVDYIYFSGEKGVTRGFYGLREMDYRTEPFVRGRIPGRINDPVGHFWELIQTERPMFAIDARNRLEQQTAK